MSKKRVFSAVSTLVGCIIGAGVMGIPYAISKAGLVPGLLAIIFVGLLFVLINLYLGEIALRTNGNFYLYHYAKKYLGKGGQQLMFVSIVVGIYGALIAYLVGQGAALSMLTGLNPLLCGVIIFVLLSAAVYAGMGFIAYVESFMMPLILLTVVLIFGFSIPFIDVSVFSGFSPQGLVLPYGILLFAFLGISAIPELKEELDKEKHNLKKAILIGSIIPMGVYILFTIAIIGMFGNSTNEIATLTLGEKLGHTFGIIGALFPIATMSTSFLALGICLNKVFYIDYGIRKNSSWLLSMFIPFIIFLLLQFFGIGSFSKVIEVTGIVTGVISVCLVAVMALKAKTLGEREPEYSIFINKNIAITIICVVIAGGLLQLAVS